MIDKSIFPISHWGTREYNHNDFKYANSFFLVSVYFYPLIITHKVDNCILGCINWAGNVSDLKTLVLLFQSPRFYRTLAAGRIVVELLERDNGLGALRLEERQHNSQALRWRSVVA